MVDVLIRVGKYNWKKKKQPETKGYTNVLVHVVESMSPFVLRNEENQIMENVWQFQKIYDHVYKQEQKSRNKDVQCWQHPAEIHWDEKGKKPTPEYWEWRTKGMNWPSAVRWPNGSDGAKECKFALVVTDPTPDPITKTTPLYQTLGYIEARKKIYFYEYARLVRETKDFKELQQKIEKGLKIQINEVDGPSKSSEAPFHLVENSSLEVTKTTVVEWLNNPSQPFGHGICLAVALLKWDHLIQ